MYRSHLPALYIQFIRFYNVNIQGKQQFIQTQMLAMVFCFFFLLLDVFLPYWRSFGRVRAFVKNKVRTQGKNNLVFEKEHYLQYWERLWGLEWTLNMPIYSWLTWRGRYQAKWTKKSDVWWRYVGDEFTVWTQGEECFIKFVDQKNNMRSKVQFTSECSTRSKAFLDVNVIMDEERITTDLFTISTDTHQYLHRRSGHPRHGKATIAYSQA